MLKRCCYVVLICCSLSGYLCSSGFSVVEDREKQTFSIFKVGHGEPLVVHNVKQDFRPYLHPIVAPDGKGVLTENAPRHHKHQTGLFWGLTRVNGRDYYHHPEGSYWQKVAAEIIVDHGEKVKWQTVYHLLDGQGQAIMEETQTWAMVEAEADYYLDLNWKGKALVDLTISKYNYGGLFLRMPYGKGVEAFATNSKQDKMRVDRKVLEGQRADWVNLSMSIEGREGLGNIAIFDHEKNPNHPVAWRVDRKYGIGAAHSRGGHLSLNKGKTTTYRHRVKVYDSVATPKSLNADWQAW